jgi:hypothetical protein
MLANFYVGELSCWRNVMLANCQLSNVRCPIVMLAKCHAVDLSVGELSCWRNVMLANCQFSNVSCLIVMTPVKNEANTTFPACTLTLFSPWNSCTEACVFINEHDGQHFTTPLYFMPSNYLRQAAWCIPWLRQPQWLAWRGKILMPCIASRICVRCEIAWRTMNAAHCCETHTNFYGAQLPVLANQVIPFYIVSPLF